MAQTLAPRGIQVTDLRTDIQDGVALINFFELLSGKRIKGYDPRPKNRIAKINNLSVAFKALDRDLDVVNPGCAAEDVIDADTKGIKLILGLLWTLFRRYRMRVEGVEGATKEEDAMLEWVRNTIKDYPVEVKNFRTSFNDGKIFLALVHAYNAENPTFDFKEAAAKPPEEVLTTAFDVAENELGVNKLLDVQEILDGNTDERSMALYTSLIHHAFKTKQDMLEMQKKLGNQNEELNLQMQTKESLLKTNYDLNLSIEQLNKSISEEHEHCDNLSNSFEDLKKERDKTAQEMEELKAKIAELKEKIEALSAKKAGQAKELSEKLMGEKNKQSELQKDIDECTEKRDKLAADVEEMKQELEETNKQNESEAGVLRRHKKTEQVVTGQGLDLLRENLLAHLDDLHCWESILEGKESSIDKARKESDAGKAAVDPKAKIIDQLNALSKTMEQENEHMVQLLKAKKAEVDAQASKKKAEKGKAAAAAKKDAKDASASSEKKGKAEKEESKPEEKKAEPQKEAKKEKEESKAEEKKAEPKKEVKKEKEESKQKEAVAAEDAPKQEVAADESAKSDGKKEKKDRKKKSDKEEEPAAEEANKEDKEKKKSSKDKDASKSHRKHHKE